MSTDLLCTVQRFCHCHLVLSRDKGHLSVGPKLWITSPRSSLKQPLSGLRAKFQDGILGLKARLKACLGQFERTLHALQARVTRVVSDPPVMHHRNCPVALAMHSKGPPIILKCSAGSTAMIAVGKSNLILILCPLSDGSSCMIPLIEFRLRLCRQIAYEHPLDCRISRMHLLAIHLMYML